MKEQLCTWIKKYKIEIGLFSAIFVFRSIFTLVFYNIYGDHFFLSYNDAYNFFYIGALNLLQHGVLSTDTIAPFVLDGYHTPLYSIVIAGFLSVKAPLLFIPLFQNALMALECLIIFFFGRKLELGRELSYITALVWALEPMSLYWGNILVSDNLYSFFIMVGIWLFFTKRYNWCSLALGLATLTRPTGTVIFVVFLLFYLYTLFITEGTWKSIVRKSAVFSVIFGACIIPWMIRNQIAFGYFQLSNAPIHEFYFRPTAAFEQEYGLPQYNPPEVPGLDYQDFKSLDFNNVPHYQEHLSLVLRRFPLQFGIFYMKRVGLSLVSSRYDYALDYMVQPRMPIVYDWLKKHFLAIFLFVLSAIWIIIQITAATFIFDVKHRRFTLLIICLFFVNLLTYGGHSPEGPGQSRYNLYIIPFIFLLFFCVIKKMYHKSQQRKSNPQ